VPSGSSQVDLDYVKTKWTQILSMLNEELLKEAEAEHLVLTSYIRSCTDSAARDHKRAEIYASLYNILVASIQRDAPALEKMSLDNLRKATALADTDLIVASRYFFSEILMFAGNIGGYIENADTCLIMEKNRRVKSTFYQPTVMHYLDAVIFRKSYDAEYVMHLLLSLYNDPAAKYLTYSLYAKFLGSLSSDSKWAKQIYKQFQVAGLESFSARVVKDAEGKINSNELSALYSECASALMQHGLYKEAYRYKNKEINTIRKIYSNELAQSLADNQTLEIKRTKAIETAKLQKENAAKQMAVTRQRQVIWVISIALFIVVLLILFLFRLIKQRNLSNNQLSSVNLDLQRLNKLNQKIFYVISHDFNAPLLTLSLMVKNLRKDADPIAVRHLDEVENQFNSAQDVLTNLLNWSKAEISIAGNNAVQKADLKQTTNEILSQLYRKAVEKKISFRCHNLENVELIIPRDILRIVLRNLVSNAIKFSHPESTVEISFYDQEKQLKIVDYGIGIDPEKIKDLFTKEVVSDFGTNYEPGFGIGLYIVAELLRKYDCSIKVDSDPGKETIFTITFQK
jgi:signal transduction histidine kinase